MYVAMYIFSHVHILYLLLPVTFNTTLLVMVALVELQLYTALLSSSVTLVITRSVTAQ